MEQEKDKIKREGRAVTEVVTTLIWDGNRFLIYQYPANKTRPLLWGFIRRKVKPVGVKEQAPAREYREELGITAQVGNVFYEVTREYPDFAVHSTLFHAVILSGTPQKLEHNDTHRVTPGEVPQYKLYPADVGILEKIIQSSKSIS